MSQCGGSYCSFSGWLYESHYCCTLSMNSSCSSRSLVETRDVPFLTYPKSSDDRNIQIAFQYHLFSCPFPSIEMYLCKFYSWHQITFNIFLAFLSVFLRTAMFGAGLCRCLCGHTCRMSALLTLPPSPPTPTSATPCCGCVLTPRHAR